MLADAASDPSPRAVPEVRPTAPLAATRTRAERLAAGREAREAVPFADQARLPDPAGRADPIAVLTSQDPDRLAELVPIRHGRMSATTFTFYRGAASVMAADLATLPCTSLGVQLCGDAHLSNFGVFNGPEGRLLFDLNDFDETHPGPFEWDLKRLLASVVLAGRDNELAESKTRTATLAAIGGYRRTMADAALLDPLELRVVRLDVDAVVESLGEAVSDRTRKAISKARTKNSLRAFDRLTELVDGQRRIVENPPLITRHEIARSTMRDEAGSFLDQYRSTLPEVRRCLLTRYRLVDAAFKVVGVGSVGTRCLIALFVSGDDDPLFLQIKEATRSVLEAHLGPSAYANSGERVVVGQRLMQAAGDPFLGWARIHPDDASHRDFYVRQLWDGKGSAAIDTFGGRQLRTYAELCGRALALAHARSGDAATISGYLGAEEDELDEALTEFAFGYADISVGDHDAHVAAIESGSLEVVRDL